MTVPIMPTLYEKCGLTNDYNVLYNAAVRNNIFRMLIIVSVIGAVLNVIPYLFYDLTEEKHHGMVKVLRIRAMFDDYGNDVLDDGELVEVMKTINDSAELEREEKAPIPKDQIRVARKLPKITPEEKPERKARIAEAKMMPHATGEEKAQRKQAIAQAKLTPHMAQRKAEIKQAKQLCREVRERNKEIMIAPFIMDEMRKFQTRRYQKQVEEAKLVAGAGLEGLMRLDTERLAAQAKDMNRKDAEEKRLRSDLKDLVRSIRTAQNLMRKHYPNGLSEPDPQRLMEAEERPTSSLFDLLKKKREISLALKEQSVYARCIKPYTQAVALIRQAENYSHLEELQARYEQVKRQAVPANS